jgi:hypothetical protein
MKIFLLILVLIAGVPPDARSEDDRYNLALASLGAYAEDNGYFDGMGTDLVASNVMDCDSVSYWAGLQSHRPQRVWIYFDQQYEITGIYIDERSFAYFLNADLEYSIYDEWKPLATIQKNEQDYYYECEQALRVNGIRLSINSLYCPSTWYNKVACIASIEVYGKSVNELPVMNWRLTPNPSDGQSTILLSTNQPGRMAIDVYDLAGHAIRTITSYEQSSDYVRAVWDGKDNHNRYVGGGVYYIKLSVGEFTDTKKCIVLR